MSENKLARQLSSRHVQMIAIGGAIGTGLFLGSGTAIHAAGPALLGLYALAGLFCFFMMRAIGELVLSDTGKSSFIEFIREYLGERWEFVVGWTYWLCWESLAMADLTASGIYIKYWFPWIPQWVTALVIVAVLLTFNLLSVGLFGELESWFSSIKVFAILALIVTGVVLLVLHAHIGGQVVTMRNLVNYGGFAPRGIRGILSALPMVIFAFTGIEMVGLTSGETAHPHRDIPKAINTLLLRIALFYVGSMFVLMCIYPWNKVTTTASPFVQVFSALGVKAAAGIINFVVLTAALSACNSTLFSTSRTLFVLAQSHFAPQRMHQTNNRSVPVSALIFSSAVLLIIVFLNYVLPAKIFSIISSVATVSFVFVWLALLWCHAKFKQRHLTTTFKMPGYPWTTILTVLFFVGVLGLLVMQPSTLLALVFAVIWVAVLLGGYSLLKWSRRRLQ
ncbi:amino acid permease [Ligilactobacillus sp. LYQ139]|uniref:amino acid permease n=1 Tax=Ligilactobacillus sp. LYQ139 TaxID=3378800 RepID=UPI0038539ED8